MSKKKAFQFFLSATCLAAAYFLSRFGLFSFHEMKQWPAVLAVTGIAVLAIAARFGCRIASATTVAGYLAVSSSAFGWAKKEPIPVEGGLTAAGSFGHLFSCWESFAAFWPIGFFKKKQKTGLDL